MMLTLIRGILLLCSLAGGEAFAQSLLNGATASNHTIPPGWTLYLAQGFEGGSVPAGQYINQAITSAQAHSGTYSTGGNVSFDAASIRWNLEINQISAPRIYISFWEFLTSNFRQNEEHTLFHFRKENAGGDPNAYQHMVVEYYNDPTGLFNSTIGQAMLVTEGAGANFTNKAYYRTSGTIPVGAWHQWEIDWQPNTPFVANSQIKLYLDGVLYASWTNLDLVHVDMTNGPRLQVGGVYTKNIWKKNGGLTCGAFIGDGVETGRCTNFNSCECPPNPPIHTRYLDDVIVMVQGAVSGDTIAPGPVTNLSAQAAGPNSAQVTWTLPTDIGGSGLKETILRRCTGASCTPTLTQAVVPSPGTSYTDNTLAASTTYGYSAAGNDNAGNLGLPFSATVYVTTPAAGAGAIAFDAHSNDAGTNTTTSSTWSHTTGAGANRAMLVCLAARGTSLSAVQSSGVTYNSVAMTLVREDTRTDGAGAYFGTALYRLVAPATGANNVVATWNAGTATYRVGSATTYTGVDQSTPIDASAGSNGNTVGIATTITTATQDAWIEDCVIARADPFVSLGAGQVQRANRHVINDEMGISTVNGKTPAGSEVMDWTATAASDWTSTVAALKPTTISASTITFDAVSDSADQTTNTVSWSHTVGTGSNRLLTVCPAARTATNGSELVSSVTYGGVNLTKLRHDRINDGVRYWSNEIWYMIAPPIGTATVTVTAGNGTFNYLVGTALSLFGVDQTNPVDAQNGATSTTGSTISTTVTTVAANAWLTDCITASAQPISAVGAGQTQRTARNVGADAVGVSTVNGKASPGAEVMDWTQNASGPWATSSASWKPHVATQAPVIDSYVRTATTATITYGTGSPTVPTSIRIFEGNPGNTSTSSVVYLNTVPPMTSTNGTTAVLTIPILSGASFSCAYARDASGNENQNSADFKCANTTGLTTDTSPPVVSNLKANGNTAQPQLPNGATSFTLSATLDKSVPCRWGTVDAGAYSSFPFTNAMTLTSLTASATIASGVPAYPDTQTYYVSCQFTDGFGATHDSTVASITVSANAPATDMTPPTAVSGVVAQVFSQTQATVAWLATTDNVAVTGYIPFCSFGAGETTYAPCGNETTLTSTIVNLPANTVVNIGVWAIDAAGNVSSNSNISTITTQALPDLNPPSNMSGLAILGRPFTQSVILTWNAGSDAEGPVTAIIEQCTQSSPPTECTGFATKQSKIALSVVTLFLSPNTSYCWRGKFADSATPANLSPTYSNVVCGTTSSTGLSVPRAELPFDVTRSPVTRVPYPGTRPMRP